MDQEEAYGAVAAEMYVPGEVDYVGPKEVLEGLDEQVVTDAKAYAETNHLPWPPIASGYMFMVTVHH